MNTNEQTRAAPSSTTVSGFAIKIDAFLLVDTKDIDSQVAASTAVKAALETRDLTAILPLMTIGEISQKFVNRRIPLAAGAAEPAPEP